MERFLQLCAEDNMHVVNCTTPAQYFHVLRRQMRRPYRAPVVIFTPKSLLRSPRAISQTSDFVNSVFQPVVDDPAIQDPSRVKRVLCCSGKVYYDLLAYREERDGTEQGEAAGDVAIVRLEELYPWPEEEINQIMERYGNAEGVFWVQEEPANMGAWTFVRERLQEALRSLSKLGYAGRPPHASTATGSGRIHRHEQAALVESAFHGI